MFKAGVGDVVVLKSGGPEMTVNSLLNPDDDQVVEVEWFVGGDLRRAIFDVDQLVLSEDFDEEDELADEELAEYLAEPDAEDELRLDIEEYLRDRPIGGAG